MSDFHRTRLTHSLEASQIGQGISAQLRQKHPELAQQLSLDDFLIEALCLAHDIGHPPFGHGGEIALHYKMAEHGGFEGNGQTFRIVSKLEPYTQDFGMNLSRRSILGLVKYPNTIDELTNTQPTTETNHRKVKANSWYPPKGLYNDDMDRFNWLLEPLSQNDKALFCSFNQGAEGKHHKTRYKSFDCSIMELADDIAYSIHDLEDAIVMGIVTQEIFEQQIAQAIVDENEPLLKPFIGKLTSQLFSEQHHRRKDAIGALVNTFITNIHIDITNNNFDAQLLKYNAVLPESLGHTLNHFKRFVFKNVISKPEIQLLEYKGQQLVMELFDVFASDPERLLPDNTKARWLKAEDSGRGVRVIADYISGMTDEFAAKLYNNVFLPKSSGLSHY
jgi:dGTPase